MRIRRKVGRKVRRKSWATFLKIPMQRRVTFCLGETNGTDGTSGTARMAEYRNEAIGSGNESVGLGNEAVGLGNEAVNFRNEAVSCGVSRSAVQWHTLIPDFCKGE